MRDRLEETTRWRARDAYLPTLASKSSLIEESRQFLHAYARLRNIDAVRQALVNGGLQQRSRATRATILKILQIRLTRWHPPVWVLDDLISFAQDGHQVELQAVLLLHTARQDKLLYDFIQQGVVPRWFVGERGLIRADVQRFLDSALSVHPEVDKWSHSTREKLSGNVLTTLRDFGLLQGTVSKRIVEPIVPAAVVQHLVRLLQEEGIPPEQLALHPDWQLWLWDAEHAQKAIDSYQVEEHAI